MAEDDGWQEIGGAFSALAAAGDVPFGLTETGGFVQRFARSPGQWETLGGMGGFVSIAGNEWAVLGSTDDEFFFWDDEQAEWIANGGCLHGLVANADQVAGIVPSKLLAGHVLLNGGGDGWADLGQVAGNLVMNDRFLAASMLDGSVGLSAGDNDWSSLAQAPSPVVSLAMPNNALYALTSDGDVLRFDVRSWGWTPVGSGYKSLSAGSGVLAAIDDAETGTFLFDSESGSWQRVGAPVDQVIVGETYLFAISNGVALAHELDPDSTAALRSTTPYNWYWTFDTSDVAFAGYDGMVMMSLYHGQQNATVNLPYKSFKRNVLYSFPMNIPLTDLDNVYIWGQDNYFNETWSVDTVTAWSLGSRNLYSFNVYGSIPNKTDGWRKLTPSSIVRTGQSPLKGTTVYVWTSQGRSEAWGHASLTLSDGTHVSWWPSGIDLKTIPFLGLYQCKAADPQTFEKDIALEGTLPDVAIIIAGLDEKAIAAWWNTFKSDPKNLWNARVQNCSTTVKDALFAGGASSYLTSREDETFDTVTVWTPSDVISLAVALSAATQSKAS